MLEALKKYKIFATIKPQVTPYRERLVEATPIKQTRKTVELDSRGKPIKKKGKEGGRDDEAIAGRGQKNPPLGGEVLVVAMDLSA